MSLGTPRVRARRKLSILWSIALVASVVTGSTLANAVGAAAASPEVSLLKDVSVDGGSTWFPADSPTGPAATAGLNNVFFRFTVTNSGATTLTNLELTDTDFQAAIDASCALTDPLGVGNSTECIIGPFVAQQGQHQNKATITAEEVGGSSGSFPTDFPIFPGLTGDGAQYVFVFTDGSVVLGSNQPGGNGFTGSKNEADLGLSATVHVSCSDTFQTGWGDKGAPVQGVDPFAVATYSIFKFKKGLGGKVCGPGVVLQPQEVTDMNEAHYIGESPPALGSVGDFIWHDADSDGVQDPGELGIGGVTVTLSGGGTSVSATNGIYPAFANLPAGDYTVTVDTSTAPAGMVLTTPGSVSVTLAAGQDFLDADFGFFTPPPTSIDLELTKSADQPTVAVGGQVTWTISVTNQGPANATGVTVSDSLPAGVTYVSDNGGGAFDSATAVWTIGNLAVNASASLQITTTVDGAGSFTNVAQVAAANEKDIDSTPGNDVATEDDQDDATVVAQTPPPTAIDLELTKSVDQGVVSIDAAVTWTITVTNKGPANATGVTVSDSLPAGVTYLFDNGGGAFDSGTGVWTVGNLAVNASASLEITTRVDVAALVRNRAQVASANETDVDSTPGNCPALPAALGEDDCADSEVGAVLQAATTTTVAPATTVADTLVKTGPPEQAMNIAFAGLASLLMGLALLLAASKRSAHHSRW